MGAYRLEFPGWPISVSRVPVYRFAPACHSSRFEDGELSCLWPVFRRQPRLFVQSLRAGPKRANSDVPLFAFFVQPAQNLSQHRSAERREQIENGTAGKIRHPGIFRKELNAA